MRVASQFLIANLAILTIAGCGKSSSPLNPNPEIQALKAELQTTQKQVAELRQIVVKMQDSEVAVDPQPVVAKVKLYTRHPKNLYEAGENLAKRIGLPEADYDKVRPGFDQRMTPSEFKVFELQKIVEALCKTAVVLPGE